MADLLAGMPERQPIEALPKEESGVEADEKALESLPESKDTFLEEAAEETMVTKVVEGQPITQVAAPPAAVPKDETLVRVEKVLEEGLGDIYARLPESAKPKFRQKGEKAAAEIASMVRSLKLRFRRALTLIRDWLLTIPNVNKFFLEQEAKIKVDLIKQMIESDKEERLKRP